MHFAAPGKASAVRCSKDGSCVVTMHECDSDLKRGARGTGGRGKRFTVYVMVAAGLTRFAPLFPLFSRRQRARLAESQRLVLWIQKNMTSVPFCCG